MRKKLDERKTEIRHGRLTNHQVELGTRSKALLKPCSGLFGRDNTQVFAPDRS